MYNDKIQDKVGRGWRSFSLRSLSPLDFWMGVGTRVETGGERDDDRDSRDNGGHRNKNFWDVMMQKKLQYLLKSLSFLPECNVQKF